MRAVGSMLGGQASNDPFKAASGVSGGQLLVPLAGIRRRIRAELTRFGEGDVSLKIQAGLPVF